MANDIDIGLFSINTDHLVAGEALSTVAVAAEQAGFESLWPCRLSTSAAADDSVRVYL